MYDRARRRQALRKGRERGCSIYVPVEELRKAGVLQDDPPPFYRVWGSPRGSVIIRLYKEA
jgi:hypothetical protein